MEFFYHIRNYIVYFVLFGVWSSWENSKYKFLLQTYSLISFAVVFYSYYKSIRIFLETYSLDTLTILLLTTTFLGHMSITIETILKSQVQFKLIQQFSFADRSFETALKKQIPYHEEKENLFLLNVVITIFIAVIKLFPAIYFSVYRSEFIFLNCLLYSKWIMHLKSIQVLFFVYLVRARLMLINKEIITVQSNMQTDQPLDQHTVFIRILRLKQIYGELFKICGLINQMCGWSMLIIFLHHFVQITCNCYWLYLFVGLEDTLPDVGTLMVSFSFLSSILVVLVILTFYCSSCFDCVSLIFQKKSFSNFTLKFKKKFNI